MIRTRFTELLGIDHPVALAGMVGGTSPELAAAVSNAGGLGIHGVTGFSPEHLAREVAAIRAQTDRPFGLNCLLHFTEADGIARVIELEPSVLSTAWPDAGQDLAATFARAHDRGIKVLHMVPTTEDAIKAADAGADVIVAQGTDGGGHVGTVGTMVIVPMVVRAVAPVPVLAAGGLADGAGLAAALALGAAGVLLGTRFLATDESPLAAALKQLIVASDGTDTIVSDLTDIMLGNDWPGALARVKRNRLVERWLGRTNELRKRRDEVVEGMTMNRERGDGDEAVVYFGQSAGLITSVAPAGQVVHDMVREAESILTRTMPDLVAAEARP